MYKMIVTGFDGVLVDDDLAISLSTMLEIDRIRRKKMLFTIATSRCLGDILYYNRDFSFLDYVIATDGAIVYDVNKEKVIFKKAVSVSCIRKIYNTFTSHDIYACRKDRKFKFKLLSLSITSKLSSRLEQTISNLYTSVISSSPTSFAASRSFL